MNLMEKHEHVNSSKKRILLNNFLGGIAWGIGATVGLAIFLAIFGLIMRNIDLVPILGPFITNIYNYVLDNSTRLQKFN